eukprot:2039831-Rhodomonas_salina.1
MVTSTTTRKSTLKRSARSESKCGTELGQQGHTMMSSTELVYGQHEPYWASIAVLRYLYGQQAEQY